MQGTIFDLQGRVALVTGGSKGLSDVTLFSGLGLMGGGMLRDLAIIATAYGVRLQEVKKAGLRGVIALFLGVLV